MCGETFHKLCSPFFVHYYFTSTGSVSNFLFPSLFLTPLLALSLHFLLFPIFDGGFLIKNL